MQNSTTAGKYLFIHFWREKNAQTDKSWNTLRTGAAKFDDSAEVVSLRITDPNEKAIVDRFNVGKAPMPLILAIAPCGAVTKAYPGNFDEKQLAIAFVSPCEALCMKAIQSRKLVFVCVAYEVAADGQAAIPQGVKDFQADEKFAKATEIVTLNATDKREAGFLKELQIDTKARKPVSVLLAPGALVGTFDSAAPKAFIEAKLVALQSDPCAGGKCGPNGCGPKK
ncbi:MAG: hypothetical protein IT426_06125 [Pirellulales bacterium]|nr:hypothetical protein [Pirellulales bacterium]